MNLNDTRNRTKPKMKCDGIHFVQSHDFMPERLRKKSHRQEKEERAFMISAAWEEERKSPTEDKRYWGLKVPKLNNKYIIQ